MIVLCQPIGKSYDEMMDFDKEAEALISAGWDYEGLVEQVAAALRKAHAAPRAEPLRGTQEPRLRSAPWLVIKPFTVDDARHAAAGILLSWLARVEMQTSDDSMHVLPAADWRAGPEEFVRWLSSRTMES